MDKNNKTSQSTLPAKNSKKKLPSPTLPEATGRGVELLEREVYYINVKESNTRPMPRTTL